MERHRETPLGKALLTTEEVSELLSVSVKTVRGWESNGRISSVRLGSRKDRRFQIGAILKLFDNTITEEEFLGGLFPVAEVAEFLHVHPGTLRKWERDGLIKAVHLPGIRGDRRFPRKSIEEFMKDSKLYGG